MSTRVYISRDAGALCVGAEQVATAFRKAAEKRGLEVEIVRTSAREIVSGIANHIKKFWDPRMRKAIFAYLDSGGDGLDPAVKDAIVLLKANAGNAGHSTETSFQGT